MKLASQQPLFLPWIGYWNRYLSVDLYLHSVGVDFTRNDTPPLNRVLHRGAWLTLPVSFGKTRALKDVLVVPSGPRAIAKTLRNRVGKKYPYAARVHRVADILDRSGWTHLVDLNIALIAEIADILGAKTKTAVNSLKIEGGSKTQNMFSRICSHTPPPFEFYIGGGTAGFIDKSQIPPAICTQVQRMNAGASPETIIDLLATAEDPATVIRQAATWSTL